MPADELEPKEPAQVNQTEEELTQARARIPQLEQQLMTRDRRIEELELALASGQQSLSQADDNLARLKESLGQAVASYKALMIQVNPEIPEELVTGDSVDAINDSLRSAQELVGKVRSKLASDAASTRVPAGAPPRTTPDLSSLSPREKIHYALGR